MLPPSFPCNPQLRRTSRSQEGGTLPARKGRDRVGSLAVLGSQILLSLVSLQFARVVLKSAPLSLTKPERPMKKQPIPIV
jgi:hypothetical protein